MTLVNILVHVDTTHRAAVRLALALHLADRERARVTGVFAELAGDHTAAKEAARGMFEQATAPLGERAAFIDAGRGGEAEILDRLTHIARSFDLVVLGQSEAGAPVPGRLPERLITDSGRPVLVVPYVGTYDEVGRRPLFAWGRTRGSARALADARLLVKSACEALVIEILRPSDERDEFAALVIAGLAAHGVDARFDHIVLGDVDGMDMLLNAAADHSADLLAIGAFDTGASLFGRAASTRFMLAHMTLPVLFSH